MDSSAIFFTLIYGAAVVFIASLFFRSVSPPPAPLPVDYVPPRTLDSVWWPLPTTSYTWWNHWTGWWSGGQDGGYADQEIRIGDRVHATIPKGRPWGGAGRGSNGQ
jgi:hypothetical protein